MTDREKTDEVEFNLSKEDRLAVFNPNPGFTYKDTWDGDEYMFIPYTKYMMEADLATTFVARAQNHHIMQTQQAKDERRSYLRCISSNDALQRDGAKCYAKEVEGEIITNTQPVKRQGLVMFNSSAGETFWKEYAELDAEQAKLTKVPVVEPETKVITTPSVEEAPLTVDKPNKNWDTDQLVGYIKRLGKDIPSKAMMKNHDLLFRRALNVFDSTVKKLEDAGENYTIDE